MTFAKQNEADVSCHCYCAQPWSKVFLMIIIWEDLLCNHPSTVWALSVGSINLIIRKVALLIGINCFLLAYLFGGEDLENGSVFLFFSYQIMKLRRHDFVKSLENSVQWFKRTSRCWLIKNRVCQKEI